MCYYRSIVPMTLSCAVSVMQCIVQVSQKFSHPHMYLAPPLTRPHQISTKILGARKLEYQGILDTIRPSHGRTEGQTDRRTDHGIHRAMHMHCICVAP